MFNLKDPARIGDAAHAFCILQTCLFAILVVGQSSSIFDSVWIQDGFCVANRDVAYMTSHDLCFYFDILGAIVCGYLYYLFKSVKGMESTNALFKNNIGGIAAHGFAHFLIAELLCLLLGFSAAKHQKDFIVSNRQLNENEYEVKHYK